MHTDINYSYIRIMATSLDHDRRLWLTYQAVLARLKTRKVVVASAEHDQGLLEDLQYPITLDEGATTRLQGQLHSLAHQAGLALPDLLRWAALHLSLNSDPRTQTLDALRLEQLHEAVEWQQRRLDAHIQNQPNPDLSPSLLHGESLRERLQVHIRETP